MKRKLMVAPSLGCCDMFKMEKEIKFIDQHADFLHMDIKDGNYVKTFGIGPDFLNYIKDKVKTPMDAHLMVKHPQNFLEMFANAGAKYITVHTDCIESDAFVTLNKIKSLGCKTGVAMNPASSLESIRYYLPLLDKVTVMIVDAGYAGQKVITQMYDKIRTLVKWREDMKLNFLIEADGSMNGDVYGPLYEAGVDVVVLGPPALWNKDTDIERAWSIMEKEISNGISDTIK
ncbi:ribulose phosphate epimerase [Clostridium thailandense]|uniref:ribulose phosphate epimerase n=1 Tax=Clostridium thailandense TaxID=2794346 RepID=UPI0039897EF8